MSSDEHNASGDLAMSLPLSGEGILARSDVQTRLPAHDLERARRLYTVSSAARPAIWARFSSRLLGTAALRV
jgi:hypothetical protein